MNNINDGSLVKTMIESGKDMYDTLSEAGSVMSAHSMQGYVHYYSIPSNVTVEYNKCYTPSIIMVLCDYHVR